MSEVRFDIWGAETRIGDIVAFNIPKYKEIKEAKVIRLTPKGITVEYERYNGKMDTCFVYSGQFARKPDMKHGRWEPQWEHDFDSDVEIVCGFCCSLCGLYYTKEHNYCPNCGAKMDKRGRV